VTGLAGANIGVGQILWANDDLPDLTPPIDTLTILDEMARLGYRGTQLGRNFPRGEALQVALRDRGLRIAEIYAALAVDSDGPAAGALDLGRACLAELHAAGGDVLVVALALTPEREAAAGRTDREGAGELSSIGLRRLARLLETLAQDADAAGHTLAFHHHVGTYVERPDELDRLMDATDPERVGLCLDVGHYLLAGGDPVAALQRYGERVRHVHLKDMNPSVAARMRDGALGGFLAGLRERVFTEIGSGALDVPAVLASLAARDYRGWIIVEQDTTRRPPSESAAISRAIVDYVLRELPRMRLAA
jgi:inosose dehydratase